MPAQGAAEKRHSAKEMALRVAIKPPSTFFDVVAACWRRPGLLMLELAWRWAAGGFLAAVYGVEVERIAQATGAAITSTGLFNASLEATIQDPTQLSVAMASTLAILKPWVMHAALGLAPLALFTWVGAFALGRTALLRRWDPALPSRGWLLAVCEAVRLLALVAFSALWYAALQWSARIALGPASEAAAAGTGAQADPNLVLYCALVISITVGLFSLWSVLSWSLLAAPLVALVEQCSFGRGFVRAIEVRRVRGRLVEVNLAMAVIKVGLVVLAVVLSATPLPFESIMQGWPLYAWWAFVTLLYLAASDFFKLARLFAFLEQVRT